MKAQAGNREREMAIRMRQKGHPAKEVAEAYGRSLAWVYKWYGRFMEHRNLADLRDRSRAPKRCPKRISGTIRQAIKAARKQLEEEAKIPGELIYIGANAIRSRLKREGYTDLPSRASIERILTQEHLTNPYEIQEEVQYPRLHPTQPHQLTQVDIVPRYLPGGPLVSCFNGIDVVSRYPMGNQSLRKSSGDAVQFVLLVFQTVGIGEYTQFDNEPCFSGGVTHPGVIGKVARGCLYVGTQPVFSPLDHPESNGTVERFHQDYLENTWDKEEMPDLPTVRSNSAPFFDRYRQSGHHSALEGHSPAEIHWSQPVMKLPDIFQLPEGRLPLTEGKIHYIRLVMPDHQISVANLLWSVPKAEAGTGVWATLELRLSGAKLRIYDKAPDDPDRVCLAQHPFPLKEKVEPLRPEFQRPIPVATSWRGLAVTFFASALREKLPTWFSTML